ncbi:helix-turn-helix domain-containing protein [Desulfatitalea alkaliphila]|uniref:XRE family transcriptional regulator n=1 Tax=Desulfatitalea alkaliphila TaxID=2929485 RepID=A0AA41R3J4_9BACT|nr:XRE family transcriptional regulator [Desulfatitalea alkaliphila]MCJ8502324.1 XRE family transcriptional regulator [Desulfatitalea alkaliphila]
MPPTDKPPINVDYFQDLTGDIDTCDDACREQIGDRIKRLREEKGLSIIELSQLTGFAPETLQAIEDNAISPQLGTIIKLSKALDSALQRLLSSDGEGEKLYTVTRRSERKASSRSASLRTRRPGYSYMSLAPEVKGRHMEALLVQLEADDDDERSVHGGEEFIFVLEGTVALNIGEERFVLEPGDSAYYLSTTPHVLTARGGRAKILAVIYSD